MSKEGEKALTPLEQANADLDSLHGHFITVLNQRDALLSAIENIRLARQGGVPTSSLIDAAVELADRVRSSE